MPPAGSEELVPCILSPENLLMEKMSAELNTVLNDALGLYSSVGSLSCHRLGTISLCTSASLWATLGVALLWGVDCSWEPVSLQAAYRSFLWPAHCGRHFEMGRFHVRFHISDTSSSRLCFVSLQHLMSCSPTFLHGHRHMKLRGDSPFYIGHAPSGNPRDPFGPLRLFMSPSRGIWLHNL